MPSHDDIEPESAALVIDDYGNQGYLGFVSMRGPDDSNEADEKEYLSDFHRYLRQSVFEFFAAEELDVAASTGGRHKPLSLGQVGVRCVFCKREFVSLVTDTFARTEAFSCTTPSVSLSFSDLSYDKKAPADRSFCGQISKINDTIRRMIARHLRVCNSIPAEVLRKIDSLSTKVKHGAESSKNYWIESALSMGLVDTGDEGIRFSRDPRLPPMKLGDKEKRKKRAQTVASQNAQRSVLALAAKKKRKVADGPDGANGKSDKSNKFSKLDDENHYSNVPRSLIEFRPLVFPEDKLMIPDYLYLVLEQMVPAAWISPTVTSSTLLSSNSKKRKTSTATPPFHSPAVYAGFACKYCIGHGILGRFFPVSKDALLHPGLAMAMTHHVSTCVSCPRGIRNQLADLLKRRQEGDGKDHGDDTTLEEADPEALVNRIWSRIQGVYVFDTEA